MKCLRLRTLPTVVTAAPSSVAQTSATLNATVNPNGGEVTRCKFEYGDNAVSYGQTAPCTPRARIEPDPRRGLRVGRRPDRQQHIPLPHLGHQRGVAQVEGADMAFRTLPNPPTVETTAASSVTQNHGDAQRHRQPERRRSRRNANSNTAQQPLTGKRAREGGAGVGLEARSPVSASRQGLSPNMPPTTSGSSRPTPGGTSEGLSRRNVRHAGA